MRLCCMGGRRGRRERCRGVGRLRVNGLRVSGRHGGSLIAGHGGILRLLRIGGRSVLLLCLARCYRLASD